MTIRWIKSLDQLHAVAPLWNDLWARSEVTLPTARAELIANWCTHFARRDSFRGLVVEHQGRFVAALPLLLDRYFGISTFALPGNPWSTAGDLLLEPSVEGREALAQMLAELRQQGSLASFNCVSVESPRWQALLAEAECQSLSMIRRPRMLIGIIEIGDDLEAYSRSRSSNHRCSLRKALKKASQAGQLELEIHAALEPEQVEPFLRECFQIEASGWKGRGGTAVLRNPTVWSFFLIQAQQLADCGLLRITRLLLDGRPIAFEYGWQSKGVYCSPKVSYDEASRNLAPGQVLRHLEIEQFYRQGEVRWFDFLGPLTSALDRWATQVYRLERVVLGLDRLVGPSLIAGYRTATRLRHTLRGARTSTPPVELPDGIQPLPADKAQVPEEAAAL